MPVTIQPATLKYKNNSGVFLEADCLRGPAGDPTELIDDTAGSGDTDITWSADKLTTDLGGKAAQTELAPAYSASSTYAVGDYCTYDGGFYVCTTAISAAEAWTAAHWTAVTVGSELIKASSDSIVPLFSIGQSMYSLTCNMTFAEVQSAIRAKKCTSCLCGIVDNILGFYLFNADSSKIVFATTIDISTMGIPSAMNGLASYYITYNSDGTATLGTGGVSLESIAKDYSSLTYPVAAGTLCLYQSELYKAKQDIPTQEQWTSLHWQITTVDEQLGLLQTNIDGKADKTDTVLNTTLSRGRKANTTIGNMSFAFGANVEASGLISFAEGADTVASGQSAHAEGEATTASGYQAHAEGEHTTAQGIDAHAEGQYTRAEGNYAHAEGSGSVAGGAYSHAEGCGTTSNGYGMHASGIYNQPDTLYPEWVANTSYQVGDKVMHSNSGCVCKTDNSDATFDSSKWDFVSTTGDTAFVIGNGTSGSARSNAMKVDWDGNATLAGNVYVNANHDSTGGSKLLSALEFDGAGITARSYTTKFGGEFSVTTAVSQNYISPYARASVTGGFSKHYTHRVTINGTEYILPTRMWFVNEQSGCKVYAYLGNLNLYISDISGVPEGTDNVPFVIIADLNNNSSIDVLTSDAGTYTIKVEQISYTGANLPKTLIYGDEYAPIEKNDSVNSTYNGFSIGVNELKSKRGTVAIGYANRINNQFSQAFGSNSVVSADNATSIGDTNAVSGSGGTAIGTRLSVNGSNMVAIGFQNKAANMYTAWASNTLYKPGDVVRVTISGTTLNSVCKTEHTSSSSYIDDIGNWKVSPSNADTAFVIGNGNPNNSLSLSNAMKVDWVGNAYMNGNVYVGCNADSTGGTILPKDVQINGTSIVASGVANIPIAGTDTIGTVKIGSSMSIGSSGALNFQAVGASEVKAGTSYTRALTPERQHASVFYGLAKAAGQDMASSSNAVGTYTAAAKAAIQSMLGVEPGVSFAETVSGTTPSITGEANVRYICGEVATLSITPPSAGTIVVRFESGTTPTVLTLPSTVVFPAGIDLTTLSASTIYEIMITDGVYGGVMTWAVSA